MADRESLRLSAILLVIGVLVSVLAGVFHPGQQNANNHPAAFAEYAASQQWTLIHLGQFVGMALFIAGLLVLPSALNIRARLPEWIGRFGAVTAGAALALYGANQAVDGVALKQAVEAWASAPATEKAARFATAEGIRWLEWGTRSYHAFVIGLALVLLGSVIVWTGRVARPIGYLMGASGLAYLAQGWIIGSKGFAAANTLPTLAADLLIVVWSVWLLTLGWRTPSAFVATSVAEVNTDYTI